MNFSLTLLFIICYFAICLFLGMRARRKETAEGFFLGERKVGVLQLMASLTSGFVGASFFLVNTALVFVYGVSAFWIFIGFLLGFLLFAKFGVFLKKRADKNKYYTLGDYFRDRHGKWLAALATFAVIVTYFGSVTNQYIGGAKLLQEIAGWSYSWALLSIAAVILAYLLMGGFKSVLKTDLLQYGIILLLPVVLLFSLRSGIHIEAAMLNPFNAGMLNIFAFLVFGIFGNFIYAELWQRVYAAKDVQTVKRAFPMAGFSIFILGVITTAFGLAVKSAFNNIDPDLAVVYGLTQLVPAGLLSFALLFIIALIMSSADTGLFVLSMSVTRECGGFWNTLTKKKRVLMTRLVLIVLSVLVVLIASFFPRMVDIVIIYSAIGMILSPLIFISWLSKKPNTQAMIVSFILTFALLMVLIFGFRIIHPGLGLFSVLVSSLLYGVLLVIGMLKKKLV